MTDEAELLEAYLARALAAVEDGEDVDCKTLCAAHPQLAAAVAEALQLQRALPGLHRRSDRVDRWLGHRLGDRYRLLARLGSGASGTVYRARDEELQRDVAVKILHAGLLGSDTAAARFLREAEVLAQHEHPHLLRIYDRGRADSGDLYLVTELLRGCSLQTVLEQAAQAMPLGASTEAFRRHDWLAVLLPHATFETSYLRQVVRWTAQLATGLQAAHVDGVFHRDVKPSNAFVRDDGSAVLLDFGIAFRSGDASATLPHAVLGTPWYMPPEQALGRPAAPTLDVYGLAATLYHLLTLRPPHDGDVHAALAAVREREPTPAARLHPDLPADLAAILDRGLAAEPRHRYPSIAALLADLEAFLDHRPVSVRPLGACGRAWRRLRRHPARNLAAVSSVAALLLLGVAVPLYSTVQAASRTRQRQQLIARLPADLSIEGWPDERLLVLRAERDEVLAELDRIRALDPDAADNLPIALLRASELLDAGQQPAAAAAMQQLAERAPTPYLRAVAACYQRATGSRQGVEAVQLADLPAPETPADCFVAGFHELRNRQHQGFAARAEALLAHAAGSFVPARDLRLLALLGCGRFDEARDEARWLEGHYGQPTARTRHTLAAAALAARHYEQAIAYADDALRLRPGRHGPWNNLGYAELRLGHLDRARAAFEQAIAVRPWFDNSRAGLCQTLRSMEDFDGAAAQARQIGAPWWQHYELANIDLAAALRAHRQGDRAGALKAAEAAVAGYRLVAADADPDNHKRNGAAASIAYAEAIGAGDPARALAPFLAALRREPRNPTQLMNLADLLDQPAIGGGDLDWLRLYLLELARDFAPDDPRLAQQRAQLLDAMQKKER